MTIRHIVAWTLATTNDEEHAAQISEISRRFTRFAERRPELFVGLDVRANAVAVPGNSDIVLIADFADEDALAAYQVDPEHLEIAEYIRSVVSGRAAIDIVS